MFVDVKSVGVKQPGDWGNDYRLSIQTNALRLGFKKESNAMDCVFRIFVVVVGMLCPRTQPHTKTNDIVPNHGRRRRPLRSPSDNTPAMKTYPQIATHPCFTIILLFFFRRLVFGRRSSYADSCIYHEIPTAIADNIRLNECDRGRNGKGNGIIG